MEIKITDLEAIKRQLVKLRQDLAYLRKNNSDDKEHEDALSAHKSKMFEYLMSLPRDLADLYIYERNSCNMFNHQYVDNDAAMLIDLISELLRKAPSNSDCIEI